MKTKELIQQLQKEDPTGELECCINGEDIHFVERLPGYYDGYYEVLTRDDSRKNCYNIIGGKLTTRNQKVKIHTLSIKDAIFDHLLNESDTDFPVSIDTTYSDVDYNDRLCDQIKKWHDQARLALSEIELRCRSAALTNVDSKIKEETKPLNKLSIRFASFIFKPLIISLILIILYYIQSVI